MKRKCLVIMLLAVASLAVVFAACGKAVTPARRGLSSPIALVEIPPGEFLMGSPKDDKDRSIDEIQHPVRMVR